MTIVNHTFSLVINTVDRAKSLHALLRALEQQAYPHFELIIVVGPTHDNTLDVLAAYNGRVQILRCPSANLSQSRNIGLLAARGDIVAYIDDDAVPSYHWLTQLNRLFADASLSGTGGKVYCINPQNSFIQHHLGIASGLAEQVDVRSSWLADIVPPGNGYQWHSRMMGTNMAYRRRDLLEVGGFDEFYQWVYDDTDVAFRLVNAGKLVRPIKETVVYHAPASSRNRQVNTVSGNWWIQTKAAFYFNIKNGPKGGNSWQDINLRSLHLWHGHLLWYSNLRRHRKISWGQYSKMYVQELRGMLSGTYHGLRRQAHDIPATSAQSMMNTTDLIRPFQNEASATQSAVDPISGRQPLITMPDPPMRICLMSMAYPPHQYEGVGRHTNLMAQGLFELGHTVHVITKGDDDTVSFYDGAYVHSIQYQCARYNQYRIYPRLDNSLNYSHAAYDRVRQLMLNDGIQVVDTPLWQMDGLVTAVSNTIPVALRLQTATKQITDIQREQSTDARLLGDMEQRLIQQAHYLVPNSQATLTAVQKVYNVKPTQGRYTIIPHGIISVEDAAIRPFPLQNPPDTLTVLYVGRLEKRKGILDLFAAIPQIVQRVANVRFIIVGGDNSHQDGFQKQTGLDYATYFARQYPNLTNRVQFKGAVSDDELQRQYQACDLFVAPSLYESFGLIYLEAMNYAKPVIGCRAGGIPEVIDEGTTGLLAEPDDSESLANAVITLLQSPEKLYELGMAGRHQLMQKFTHVEMARNFAAVYRQMIHTWPSLPSSP